MPTAAAACEKLSAQIISLFICEQVLYSTFALTGGTDDTRYLFDGLNGTYDAEAGQANCHKEGGVIVPEKGYRAEVMNLKIKGGKLFSSAAVEDKENKITGIVYNCEEVTE